VLSFALEALAKAPPKAEPDLLPAVERIAISPRTTEVDVRASAWKVLLRHLAARPDAAPRIAAFFRDAAKHGEFYELGIVAPLEASPVTERMELLRSILGLDLELADAEWLSNIFSTLPPEDAAPLYAGAARLDTPAKRAMLVGVIDLGPLAKSSGGLEFLKGIALDPSLPPEARYSAYAIAGEAGKAWLDWLQLAEADDPILGQMKVSEEWMRQLPRSAQDRFLAALAKSRRPATRAWRLDLYPRERTEYRTVMIEALDDPSEFVQEKAVRSLLDLKEVQPALYARLLEHPIGKQNPKVYEQASLYDDPRILEQLVQLLDDPNPRFRVPALRALKTMRETMETKKEWRAILKAAKEGRKQ
jgi:hypothetical protein